MKEKDEMIATLRNLNYDRAAVRLMGENLPSLEADIKTEISPEKREVLETERARLLANMEVTKHHISRLEQLLDLLSVEERGVLERMVINPSPGGGFELAEELVCDTTRIYRIRSKALQKLIRLRYGAGTCA